MANPLQCYHQDDVQLVQINTPTVCPDTQRSIHPGRVLLISMLGASHWEHSSFHTSLLQSETMCTLRTGKHICWKLNDNWQIHAFYCVDNDCVHFSKCEYLTLMFLTLSMKYDTSVSKSNKQGKIIITRFYIGHKNQKRLSKQCALWTSLHIG